jgi:membrane-associated phospholipid phosphatase
VRTCLVVLALAGLLVPQGRGATQLMIAAPLAVAAVWRRGERAFLLWALYALGYVVFVTTRGTAHAIGMAVQFEYVVEMDRLIGLGELPTHRLQRWLYTPGHFGLRDYFSVIVHGSFFFLQTLLAAVLWFVKAEHWRRYVVASVVTWGVALAIIIALPTAPPWMAGSEGTIAPVHRILYDLFTGTAPGVYEYGVAIAGENPVAAMPSLHFAGALLVSLGLWCWHWTARLPAVLYSLGMAFALVYLGEHYVADLIVAAAIVAAAWRLTPASLRDSVHADCAGRDVAGREVEPERVDHGAGRDGEPAVILGLHQAVRVADEVDRAE